jgi:hypothetical protein
MKVNEITPQRQFNLSKLNSLLQPGQSRSQIIKIIKKVLWDETGEKFRVTAKISKNVDPGNMAISAFYDPEDHEDGEEDYIEIEVFFNNTDKTVDWSEGGKEYFINELSDAVKHELLHASQYSGRDFADGRDGYDKRDDNYEYMTRPDEIEAYAMNIADELVRKAGGKEDALQLLRMAGKTASFKDQFGRFLSPNLMAYFSMYDWKAEHPVVKRLLKKIFTFISNMD